MTQTSVWDTCVCCSYPGGTTAFPCHNSPGHSHQPAPPSQPHCCLRAHKLLLAFIEKQKACKARIKAFMVSDAVGLMEHSALGQQPGCGCCPSSALHFLQGPLGWDCVVQHIPYSETSMRNHLSLIPTFCTVDKNKESTVLLFSHIVCWYQGVSAVHKAAAELFRVQISGNQVCMCLLLKLTGL